MLIIIILILYPSLFFRLSPVILVAFGGLSDMLKAVLRHGDFILIVGNAKIVDKSKNDTEKIIVLNGDDIGEVDIVRVSSYVSKTKFCWWCFRYSNQNINFTVSGRPNSNLLARNCHSTRSSKVYVHLPDHNCRQHNRHRQVSRSNFQSRGKLCVSHFKLYRSSERSYNTSIEPLQIA